jgi:hypothetical protein
VVSGGLKLIRERKYKFTHNIFAYNGDIVALKMSRLLRSSRFLPDQFSQIASLERFALARRKASANGAREFSPG